MNREGIETVLRQNRLDGPRRADEGRFLHWLQGNEAHFALWLALQDCGLLRSPADGERLGHLATADPTVGRVLLDSLKLASLACFRTGDLVASRGGYRLRLRVAQAVGSNEVDRLLCLCDLALGDLAAGEETDELLAGIHQRLLAKLGPDDPCTAYVTREWAELLSSLQGNAPAELPRWQRLVSTLRAQADGHADALLADCLEHTAVLLQAAGRDADACQAWEEIRQIREASLGPTAPDTFKARNNHAMLLIELGGQDEGIAELRFLVRHIARAGHRAEPGAVTALENLGTALFTLDRAGEALPHLEQAWQLSITAHGEADPKTLVTLNHLARCLLALGRYGEALPLVTSLHDLCRDAFGENDRQTLEALSHRAICLGETGRADEALPHCERLHRQYEQELGARHPETLTMLLNLASCLTVLGRPAEALPLFEQGLEGRRSRGGQDAATFSALRHMGECLGNLGRHAEALACFEEAHEGLRRLRGESHPDTLIAQRGQAVNLLALDRGEAALPLLHHAYQRLRETQGGEHLYALVFQHDLAVCLERTGHVDEALSQYRSVVGNLEAIHGADHPRTLLARNNLAECLAGQNRLREAASLHRETAKRLRRLLGASHPDTLVSQANACQSLGRLGEPGQAWAELKGLLDALQVLPQPSERWLCAFNSALQTFALLVGRERVQTRWKAVFAGLDRALRECLDLQAPEQLAVARETAKGFYDAYTGFCLVWDELDPLPIALAGKHGRKVAAMAAEIAAQDGPAGDGSLGRYSELRTELRQLALELSQRDKDFALSETPETGSQQAADQVARLARYKTLLAEYQALRRSLGPFAAAPPAELEELAIPALQRELTANQCLGLLFPLTLPAGESMWLLVIFRDSRQLLPMGWLETRNPESAAQVLCGVIGDRYAFPDKADEAPVPHRADPADMAAWVRDRFWPAVRSSLQPVTEFHLVTHGTTHTWPFDEGCPPGVALFRYPGLAAFHGLRRAPTLPHPEPQHALLTRCHDALDGPRPIPLVNAEVTMARQLWLGTGSEDTGKSVDRPLCALIACHGHHDDRDPALAWLQPGPVERLDFQAILQRRWPPVLFLSACLAGRITEDPDGDPLGLISAFFLAGARVVIAAMQPVPDLYMQLLSTLFFQTWIRESTHPVHALRIAKHRLRTGDWYPETGELLRQHCPQVMDKALLYFLEQGRDEALVHLTHAWPFPTPYRELMYLSATETAARLAELKAIIAVAADRKSLVASLVDTLIKNRDMLPVEDLVRHVQVFGR